MNPFFKADDKICPLCKKETPLHKVTIANDEWHINELHVCERCSCILTGAKFYPGPLTFDPAVEIPAIKATMTITFQGLKPTPAIKMEHKE